MDGKGGNVVGRVYPKSIDGRIDWENPIFIHKNCGGQLILRDIIIGVASRTIGDIYKVIEGIMVQCTKCGKRIYIKSEGVVNL